MAGCSKSLGRADTSIRGDGKTGATSIKSHARGVSPSWRRLPDGSGRMNNRSERGMGESAIRETSRENAAWSEQRGRSRSAEELTTKKKSGGWASRQDTAVIHWRGSGPYQAGAWVRLRSVASGPRCAVNGPWRVQPLSPPTSSRGRAGRVLALRRGAASVRYKITRRRQQAWS